MIPIIKTSSELDKLRESGRVVDLVHNELKRVIVPGITTKKLEEVAIRIIAKEEGVPCFKGYRGYPHSICTSIGMEIVHGFPSDRKLIDGDMLSVDVGVYKNGFYGDAAFTMIVGVPRCIDDMSLLHTTKICLGNVIQHVKEGVSVGSIGNIIEATALLEGFYVVKNYIGHGIGRKLHETPPIYNYGKDSEGIILKAGQCICVEPMLVKSSAGNHVLEDGWTVVTDDGLNSTHIEQQIIVHKNHAEIIAGRC